MTPAIVMHISEYLAAASNKRLDDPFDPRSENWDERAVLTAAVSWPPSLDEINALCGRFRKGALIITYMPKPEAIAEDRYEAFKRYVAELEELGLPPTFAGYAAPPSVSPPCIVGIHDPQITNTRSSLVLCEKPIAIVTAYNEEDVIRETVLDLVEQGCQVVFRDHWSTDGTYETIASLLTRCPDLLELERFPVGGPAPHFELQWQLQHKEEIALRFPGRWILHTDADELRRTPVLGLSLREGLSLASACGCNRVSFTCLDFRPVDHADSSDSDTLENRLQFFEHGTRGGHFQQAKAWLQGAERVDLATSGGHIAHFLTARDFRYRFLLKHYPIRSQEHGMRKIVTERRLRYSPHERQVLNWHTHYNKVDEHSNLTWRPEKLFRYDHDRFWVDHCFLVITDLVERLFTRSQFSPTSVIGAHR